MNQEKVGKFIANCRKEKNITQSQLEQIIGVDRRTISKWEKGLVNIDVSLLEKLAETLDVSVMEILHGEYQEQTMMPQKQIKNKKLYVVVIIIVLLTVFGLFHFIKNYYNFNTRNVFFYKDGYQINGKIIYNKANKQIFINKIIYNNAYSAKEEEIITNQVKVTLYYKERELLSSEHILEENEKDTMSNILRNMILDYVDNKKLIKSIEDLNLIIEYLNKENERQYIKVYLQTY